MKRNVLYVDDETDNQVVFEASFDEHFNVYMASSGQEALELAAKHVFPVVIADQRMPGMTGAELFEILRRRHPQAKRIMLTGYADSAAMLQAINQGQVYYFCKKPWERDSLFSVIVRAIEAFDMSAANSVLTDRLVAEDRCATIGRTAARVAHEMGNQLGMLPLLELIEDEYADNEDLVAMAAITREAHDRLVELVNELKAFARFEQHDGVRQKVNLSDAIMELAEFLRYDQSLPIARVRVDIRNEAIITSHKVKLQQVLVNLLKNAAHAIAGKPDGQITMSLDADATTATICVTDNGYGMSPETAAHIWEPFFTTKGDQGNGLGLDIAKSMVESHGGTITCESAPGRGAAFTIRLPLAAAAATPIVVDLIAAPETTAITPASI